MNVIRGLLLTTTCESLTRMLHLQFTHVPSIDSEKIKQPVQFHFEEEMQAEALSAIVCNPGTCQCFLI